MPRDNNRRLLANIHIEKSEGSSLEKLASCGFNPFILHHRHRLKKAIDKNKEIFNLPEEAFTYPFRTRDMRRLTLYGHNAVYEKHRQITNKPGDPTLAWAPIERSAPLDKGDKSGSMPSSNNFFLHCESRCLILPRTIPDAGHGLFVQPHKNTIRIESESWSLASILHN